jgi:16S rRNA (guanine527-N7)-methyltransferase
VSSSSLPRRIEERAKLAGISIESEQLEQLADYYRLLEQWNTKIRLTALSLADCPPATIDRLFVEPLIAAAFTEVAPSRWFDLGSGGGSPAVPMRIMLPGGTMEMVEANERKSAFLREVLRTLSIEGTVRTTRVESLHDDLKGTADLVTIRAVRLDSAFMTAVGDLLGSRGQLMLFRSSSAEPLGLRRTFQLVLERPLSPSSGVLATYLRR